MILICISLVVRDVEHIFMCLMSSLEECFFRFSTHVLMDFFLNFRLSYVNSLGFPGGSDSKESACNVGDPGFNPWVGKVPKRREWHPTPVFLPGEFHGPVGSSPWVTKSRTGLSN